MAEYTTNTPLPRHWISVDQEPIADNFTSLEEQFSVDHDTLLAAGATGKHLKITLPERSIAPKTAEDEGALYTAEVGENTELYFQEENNGDVVNLINIPIFAFASLSPSGRGLKLDPNSFNIESFNKNFLKFKEPAEDTNYLICATKTSANGSVVTIEKTINGLEIKFQELFEQQPMPFDVLILRI